MVMQLYCMGESGNAYKAALTLELAGVDWEPVFVDFFNGEARKPEWREQINVMGEVPALIDGDVKLSQSAVIQQYVIDKTGSPLGGTPEEKYEVMRWVLWDNNKMSSQAGPLRFMTNFLSEKHRSDDVIKFLHGRTQGALEILNKHLDGRDWIVGDAITVADISCCAYLFYPETFGFDRADWPHIDAWLTRISDTPGWKHPYDLMPGHPDDRA
ncbi:MAG: glutathione S-transferase family protein [Pseudomonadota bacterium]